MKLTPKQTECALMAFTFIVPVAIGFGLSCLRPGEAEITCEVTK